MLSRGEAKGTRPFFTGRQGGLFEALLFKMTMAADEHSPSNTYDLCVLEGEHEAVDKYHWDQQADPLLPLSCQHTCVHSNHPQSQCSKADGKKKKPQESRDPQQGIDSLATDMGDAIEIDKQKWFCIVDTFLKSKKLYVVKKN